MKALDTCYLAGRSRAGIVVHLVVLGLLVAVVGCGSGTQKADGALVEQSGSGSDDELLFESVLDVFAEQRLEVHLKSANKGLVLTKWTEVNREVRHRWVARVVRVNVGLILKVHSEYERRVATGGETEWVGADDPYTLRDSQRDEQKMGTAIQDRFRALGGGKS